MKNIKYLEEEATADIAFIASGDSLDEAFSNAGLALYHTIVDLNIIDPKISFEYEWEAEDLNGLLYDYLDDLIFYFDTKKILLSKIESKIQNIGGGKFSLKIKGKGDFFDNAKHEAKIHIKAVTFFGMEIREKSVKVTLDI
jgi:SHS2 domain-containing protein